MQKENQAKRGMEMLKLLVMCQVLFIVLSMCTIIVDARTDDLESWEDYIEIVAEEAGICPELVEAVIERESSWNPDAQNGNCIGLMQINPKYQQERMQRLGVEDLKDPYDNILVGTDYLRELFETYGDIYAVLMFYNAGYPGLNAYLIGNYSDYAVEVAARSAELERSHGK